MEDVLRGRGPRGSGPGRDDRESGGDRRDKRRKGGRVPGTHPRKEVDPIGRRNKKNTEEESKSRRVGLGLKLSNIENGYRRHKNTETNDSQWGGFIVKVPHKDRGSYPGPVPSTSHL